MAQDVLLVAKEGNIATLTINRPEKRNALSLELLYRLADAFDALREDSDIRVVVLRGAGEKAFCSGIDMQYTDAIKVAQESLSHRPLILAVGWAPISTYPLC